MAIRIREVEKYTFAEIKTWFENILTNETSLTAFIFEQLPSLGGNIRAVLTQIFTSVATAVFDGSGLDDLTSGGTYVGTEDALFEVEIDATGTPDTYKWRKDGGTYTTGVAVTGAAQTLSDAVTVTFAATTGHTLADEWSIKTMIA